MSKVAGVQPQAVQAISVFRPADAALTPVDGQPGHSVTATWMSPDRSKIVGAYRITAGGEPFEFLQRFHETTFILSGHMIVTLEDGQRFDLRAGDMVQVVPGTRCTIEVVETVHDFFVITSADGPVQLET